MSLLDGWFRGIVDVVLGGWMDGSCDAGWFPQPGFLHVKVRMLICTDV